MSASGTRGKRSAWLAAAGAGVALVLAGAAAAFARSTSMGPLALACFGAAGVVLAATTAPFEIAAGTEPDSRQQQGRVRPWLVLVAGIAVAVLLGALAFERVRASLVQPGAGYVVGPALWFASLVVLLAVVSAARPLRLLPEAWTAGPWSSSPRSRRVLFLTLGALIAAACAARLAGLGVIPNGINPDEGNRGATAIAILTGHATRNVFDSTWYFIPNLFFAGLATVFKVFGIGYVQARVPGAVAGALTVVVTVWIALRHFGARAAVLTAILAAFLGVSLQFARETTEATPTALLWALSIAFFLEAARHGRLWAWAGAGVAGGLSFYFYPTGRLWAGLALSLCLYFVVRLGSGRRGSVLAGSAATGLAALLTVGPFLASILVHPEQFLGRAHEVSIFYDDNASRLGYYNPHWNTVELLWAQLNHSLAIFGSTGDAGSPYALWPTGRPILGIALTVLTLLGLAWFSLSWRSVPRFTLALWFWFGFVGVVVTVDTPYLERMATAVPVIPLLAAGVLDELAERVSRVSVHMRPEIGRLAGPVAGGCAVAAAAVLAFQQGYFYFVTYGRTALWPQPNIEGRAVADQGSGALVVALADRWNAIDSGWVRFLAPHVARAGVMSPGSDLPLPLAGEQELGFVLYPEQGAYLPFLESVYPGGSVHRYTALSQGVVTTYRVPRQALQQVSGARAGPVGGRTVRVGSLGAIPAGMARFPARLRWTALFRVPQSWNYSFRLGPGPARLRVDGRAVLSVPRGESARSATVALAGGEHFVVLDALARSQDRGPSLEWRIPAESASVGPAGLEAWRRISSSEIVPAARPEGLFGTIRGGGLPSEDRLDGTLATAGLLDAGGKPFVAQWSGFLDAPRAGRYMFSLFSQGLATLALDGRTVLRTGATADTTTQVPVVLRRGQHAVRLIYRVDGAGSGLEWSWQPPGGRKSVVPPSVLSPPRGKGVGPPVPDSALAGEPRDEPLVPFS